MKSHVLVAVVLAGAVQCAAAETNAVYDDARVSREFVRTTGYFCGNGDPVGSSLKWILETCCAHDTHRYLRIAKETAAATPKFTFMAIALVKKHGGLDDLPFLYQYTNDTECAANALMAILKVGGLTEEAIAAVGAYMASTNACRMMARNDVASELFRAAAVATSTNSLKAVAASNALYFAVNSSQVRYNDISFINADPTYEFSKRRLSVLRSVLPRCQGCETRMDYATNAINELVAYPESALPD